MWTPVCMEPLLGYHPCSIGFLTSRRDPAVGQCQTVHGKIYEVEKENVGVESGHRIELVGEKAGGMTTRAVKRGIRSHKLKPYRAAAAA